MEATPISVQVDYDPIVHSVEARFARANAAAERMPRAVRAARPDPVVPCQCTLLELVQAIGEVTEDDREVVATVIHLLESGQVRLCGNFRDQPIDQFRVG